jgi:hypothetical protein
MILKWCSIALFVCWGVCACQNKIPPRIDQTLIEGIDYRITIQKISPLKLQKMDTLVQKDLLRSKARHDSLMEKSPRYPSPFSPPMDFPLNVILGDSVTGFVADSSGVIKGRVTVFPIRKSGVAKIRRDSYIDPFVNSTDSYVYFYRSNGSILLKRWFEYIR